MNVLVGVVVVVLVLLAVVVITTGSLGAAGRLPGNGLLGVRTPETRRSPEAWQLANRAAGPAFVGAGVALLLGAFVVGIVGGWVGVVAVVLALGAALVLLNLAGLAGARAAAIWQQAQPDEPDEAGGCCGGTTADASAPTSDHPADPAAECGVSGGCGSCALSGMCESSGTASTGERA